MRTAMPTKVLSARLSTALCAIALVALIASTIGANAASAAPASPASTGPAANAAPLDAVSSARSREVPSLTNTAMQPGNGPGAQLYVGLGLIGLSLLALGGGVVVLLGSRRPDREPRPMPVLQPTGSTTIA